MVKMRARRPVVGDPTGRTLLGYAADRWEAVHLAELHRPGAGDADGHTADLLRVTLRDGGASRSVVAWVIDLDWSQARLST